MNANAPSEGGRNQHDTGKYKAIAKKAWLGRTNVAALFVGQMIN